MHGCRNIKTTKRAHSAECQLPVTKGGSLNLTGLNDFFLKQMSSEIIGGARAWCPHGSYAYVDFITLITDSLESRPRRKAAWGLAIAEVLQFPEI